MKSMLILLAVVAVMAGAEAVPPLARTIRTSKGDVVIENVLAGAKGGGGLLKSPESGSFAAAPKIVGGLFVNNISKFSQVVAIVSEDKRGRVESFCSGVIIDKKVVLSAAHCFPAFDKQLTYYACSGTVDINRDTKTSKCEEILSAWVPRKYKTSQPAYDMALLKLSRQITGSHAKRVKVSFAKPKNGLKAFSVGFGKHNRGLPADGKMRSAAVKIVLNEGQCKALNRYELGNKSELICAKSNNAALCDGDSGGPLLVETKKNEYICVGTAILGGCTKGAESVYSSFYDKDHAKVFKAAVKAVKGTYLTGKLPNK